MLIPEYLHNTLKCYATYNIKSIKAFVLTWMFHSHVSIPAFSAYCEINMDDGALPQVQ